MKKIWVLRYNDGTADVWDEEKGPPSWPYVDAFDVEGALKELHSDYAAILARHNALRKAVAWERECEELHDSRHAGFVETWENYTAARAEVDRMLSGES